VFVGLFKKRYTVRQYSRQTITDGYASAKYAEANLLLDVQPLSPDEMQALPEGDRTVKRIKSFGGDRLTSADEFESVPGDRLFYNGQWYECVSSVMWDHTVLSHYRSEFVVLSANQQEAAP